MKTDLRDYIHVTNLMPEKVCDTIVSEISETDAWGKHQWYNQETQQYNDSDPTELDSFFPERLLHDTVSEYIIKALDEYHDKVGVLDEQHPHLVSAFSNIRMNRYTKDTRMKTHFDHIHDTFDGTKKGIPVLSIVGLLNDDFEGGEFTFFDDYTIPLRKGDLVVFPSVFLYPHTIRYVTKGVRYSWVTWCW